LASGKRTNRCSFKGDALLKTPDKPSEFASFLGLALGQYDPKTNSYTATLTPDETKYNFFGFIHGGFLAAIFDEITGMVACFMYGVDSVVTEKLEVSYHRLAFPRCPITFEARLVSTESDGKIQINGQAICGDRILATASSTFRLRVRLRKDIPD